MEHARALDIRDIARGGWLRPWQGWTSSWHRGESVVASLGGCCLGADSAGRVRAVRLDYAMVGPAGDRRPVRYEIALDWTPCRYGGARPWWRCPARGCGRRCALLYESGDYFACRRCASLTYECRREHRNWGSDLGRVDRALVQLVERWARCRSGSRAERRLAKRLADLREREREGSRAMLEFLGSL